MAATAAVQPKRMTKQGYSYYGNIPRVLCTVSSGLTIFTKILGGFLSSFSGKEDESGNVKTFNGTRERIQEYVGGSPATISRSISSLKSSEYVSRRGISTYEFNRDKLENDKSWKFPLETTTREFAFTDKDGNVYFRKLTPGAQLVYSYIYTKLSKISFKTSLEIVNKKVAELLGIDPTTVADALEMLKGAKLIYYPEEYKGVNGYRKGKVKLVRKWSWFKKENEYRARKDKKRGTKVLKNETKTPKTETGAALVQRDKYYEELRNEAQQKASEALDVALSYAQYNKLYKEIKQKQALFRRALTSDMDYAKEISAEVDALITRSRSVLDNIGIDPRQLEPEYYHKCKKCGDTGWMKDGKACRCFNQRGSPPRNDKRTTKGIE